jgi:low affinity Fe/Cu permease
MSDMTTYIHMSVTVITSLMAVVLAYLKLRDDKVKKEAVNDEVCKQDFQALQTKVSVLEERINNEIKMLDKLDDKLDQIRDKI